MSKQLQPPGGGRIHLVKVPVNPSSGWNGAINAVMSSHDPDDIRAIGDQYPAVKQGSREVQEIILVNFGEAIPNIKTVFDWANEYDLQPEQPRGIFAIGECKPQLYQDPELNLDQMIIVSPAHCFFYSRKHMPYVRLKEGGCQVGLLRYNRDFGPQYWFGFRRATT